RSYACCMPLSCCRLMDVEPGSAADTVSSLIEHTVAVRADATLDEVELHFKAHAKDYAAVINADSVIGLIRKLHVSSLLSGRYGFALYGRQHAAEHTVPCPIIVAASDPLRAVLDRALSRSGDAFYEDIVVVDERGALQGLISTEALVQAQSRHRRALERR